MNTKQSIVQFYYFLNISPSTIWKLCSLIILTPIYDLQLLAPKLFAVFV